MTAAIAARAQTNVKPDGGHKTARPVAASTIIYKNTIVVLNATGGLVPAGTTATFKPGGMLALETVNNSAGALADKYCEVQEGVEATFDATSITAAMVGDPMYAADDQTFDDVGTNSRFVGWLSDYISTTKGRLYLPGPVADGAYGRRLQASSVWFNLDNGAGTTIDDILLKPTSAITITAARAVYVDATTGTVAAGTFQVGTTLGGADVVAATAYENTKAVGTSTAGTVLAGAIAAGGAVFVRHTGVATTQAGQVRIEIEYYVNR